VQASLTGARADARVRVDVDLTDDIDAARAQQLLAMVAHGGAPAQQLMRQAAAAKCAPAYAPPLGTLRLPGMLFAVRAQPVGGVCWCR